MFSRTHLSRLVRAEDGASAVEYGLLIAGIALVIFASVILLGQTVMTRFYQNAEKLFS